MDAVKKSELIKIIAEIEVQIEIEDTIRSIVNKFKHYKQVNKRFVDAIKEIESYHAWIIKDYKHQISVSKTTGQYQTAKVELYVYGEELTWEKVLHQLDRHDFRGQLLRYKQKLARLDTDIEDLRKILAYIEIEGCEVKNFSLYSIKSKLEHAIKYSGE